MNKQRIMDRYGLTEAQYRAFERKARRRMLEEFGDPAEMDVEELLMAISVVSSRLHDRTGERRYKDGEEIALQMLDGHNAGLDAKTVVARAEKTLRTRGYGNGGGEE